MAYQFDSVEEAIEEIKKGRLVVIMDSKDREYEGDFVGAARLATPETINFMTTYARGAFIAVFMPSGRCDQLEIPPMGTTRNESFNATNFRVAVDLRKGTSGSSAFERAKTVNLLGDSKSRASDFVRPGHVIPIEANAKGLRGRKGHTEAGVELVRLAGIEPSAAVDLEILDDNGQMAKEKKLFELARQFNLKIITVDQVLKFLDIH